MLKHYISPHLCSLHVCSTVLRFSESVPGLFIPGPLQGKQYSGNIPEQGVEKGSMKLCISVISEWQEFVLT